ncbi:MAG: nucleoside-diphosphate sugar epimerase/dehydratase [Planctomycetota bacterium]|nr:nucleoside-diphosphate sugar epimerase/dehydratase [Planctomycetota bacterium]
MSDDITKPEADGTGNGFFERCASAAIRHHLAFNLVVHNVLFALALLLTYLVWFEAAYRHADLGNWFVERYLTQLPFFLIVKSIFFHWMKLFRGWWQYAGIRDVVNILIASWIFLFVAYGAMLLLVWLPPQLGKEAIIKHYSKGVLVLDFMATVFLVCTARLGVRFYREELRPSSADGVRRVLIVGAGNAAEALLREIHRMKSERYRVVGLVDDDPTKKGIFIHGIGVLGTVADIRRICEEEEDIDEILIAVPSATQKELRRIINVCQGTKLKFQILPSMDALIDGRFTVSQIRKVQIEDLLGRETVKLDTDAIAAFVNGRRVLVTGAGGSIGAEMCRQICLFTPARLVLLEQAENGLFDIAGELQRDFPDIPIASIICDIYDRSRVMSVFEMEKPDVVVHAAAHKHVPLMETNPCEAVKNNIFGTRNVADASCRFDVKEFVQISTDKAVNPSSVMGATKRVAEIYTQSLNGRTGCLTQFKSVRFGNVLGSSGSVVPTFERQIRQGGPVTVTDPEMTRYFMTIPEASQLVLQAAATGSGGEIFLLDMGEPVKIVDLARDMITLSGMKVGEDIDITFTGVRPGEKLFEELRIAGEDIAPTVHPKIKIWKHQIVEWDLLERVLEELQSLINCSDRGKIITAIKRLVPEYTPQNSSSDKARGLYSVGVGQKNT